MLASTIQFTTNPPTPTPHHPSNRQQNTGQATRAHCPRTPTACHPPHTQGAPTNQRNHHDHNSRASPPQQACFLHHTQPTTPTAQNRRNQPAMHSNLRARHPLHRPARTTLAQTRQTTKKRRRQTAPHKHSILRKEVIQPHLPVRLPCYDFVPITSPTFDRSP